MLELPIKPLWFQSGGKMKLSLNIFLLVFTAYLYAGDKPYQLPITRHGVTHTMIAYNFWSGEYPKPVIHVQSGIQSNWHKMMGYASLRRMDKRKKCTIRSGIYHPWSKDKISLINYYSIVPRVSYLVQNNTTINGQKFKKGDRLENEIYLAEGSCSYTLNGKKARFETYCIDEDTHFKKINYPSHPSEQWLYLNCKEGYNVFVQDRDLLTQPNVNLGQISEYGKVTEK